MRIRLPEKCRKFFTMCYTSNEANHRHTLRQSIVAAPQWHCAIGAPGWARPVLLCAVVMHNRR